MRKRNGSVVVRAETKYEKRGLSVVEEVFLHDGERREYRYVVLAPSLRVVPVTPRGEFILIREFKYPVDAYVLGFPAGTWEHGESLFAAAKRELEEETGYTAERFVDLGPYYPMAATIRQESRAVLALHVRRCRHVNGDRYERTNITVVRMRPLEVIAAIGENRLLDGQALSALCKGIAYLGHLQAMVRDLDTAFAASR